MEHTSLTELSPIELLATLDTAWTAGNRTLAKVLAYLGEVERRRLYADMSCASMFVFVERRFGLTGGSAFRRLTAARLVRRHPSIMKRVEDGDIHLEALCALRDVLTSGNVDELMARTAKKTLREVESIVACLAPRPDVKGTIRKMPERHAPAPAQTPIAAAPVQTSAPAASEEPEGPLFVASRPSVSSMPVPDAGAVEAPVSTPTPTPAPIPVVTPRTEPPRPRVQQLSEARHKVQLTVSSETRAKIERAQALMKHRNPSGDLEAVFDRAMDALIEKLEKERFAKTSRPQSKRRPSKGGEIPAETRREVFARDGEACTHVDEHGNRCGCREFLELDHIKPRSKGGTDDPWNLRVVCRTHNRLYAERELGKEFIEERIAASRHSRSRRVDSA